jgi:glycine/D-amino acid oxidase-like deaminating enzyme
MSPRGDRAMPEADPTIISGFETSHWRMVTPALPELPQLAGDVRADVVVVGAGFTGLSAALHLLEAGVNVAVVEAMEPGFGASGRNNGQVIPTLTRADPDMLVAKHGAAGDRFADLIGTSAAQLFDLVRRHGLQAEAEQQGWMQPAHSPGRLKLAEARVRQWQARGQPAEMLSRDQVIAMTGSGIWHGGWWNRTGGHINPLALSRELARRVVELGGQLFARSPVETYVREGQHWVARTAGGSVRARGLVLATHAYTGAFARSLNPDVAREVVPVLSWQMATEPLGHNVRSAVLPGRQAMSDTHGDLYFARYDARHQLITGGALAIAANGHERLRSRIGERLKATFPQIGDVRFSAVWNGYIAMTSDYTPRVHRIGPDAYAWAGCNGRGVALSVALGAVFARALTGTATGELPLPLTDVRPLPFHGLIRRAAPLMLLEYRRRDAREIS